MRYTPCFLAVLFSTFFGTFAMAGGIKGTVHDKNNGDPLIGAGVKLQATETVVFTDVNGAFSFRDVTPGTYELVIAMDGFSTTRVEDVKVAAEEITALVVEMDVAGVEAEMVVTAQLSKDSEVGLLQFRKGSNAVMDAISIEEISKMGGGSAADAVPRITGASLVGGKYVFIRGLGDRYTSTHLNGVELNLEDSRR